MSEIAISPAASGMNLAGMRDYTYALADEVPNGVFPARVVDGFINAGVKIVARTVPPIPSILTFDTVDGQALYPLTDPLIEGKDSRIGAATIDGLSLSQTDLTTITNRNATGKPTMFYSRGATVGLWLVPNGVWTIEVEYDQEPPDLVSDTDVPPMAVVAREAACIYAAYRMKLRDDEYNSADRLKAEFDRTLNQLAGPRAGVYKAG